MADAAAKRIREARKRRKKEIKADRKRLRKDGLLEKEENGYFHSPDELPPQNAEDARRLKEKDWKR